MSNQGSTKNTTLDTISGIGTFIFSFLLFKYLGWVTMVLFICAILIGLWFPKWYLKKESPSRGLIRWIVWSNILTWLLPPLGIMTGLAALGLSSYSLDTKKKYRIVAICGIVFSFLNAFCGVMIHMGVM